MSDITIGRVAFGKAIASGFADGVTVREDEVRRRVAVAVKAETERCAKVNDALLKALETFVEIAKETRIAWEEDRDTRVGKILFALSGENPTYRADIRSIHAAIALAKEGK